MSAPRTYEDFRRFTAAQLQSLDLDPLYPVLASLIQAERLDREQAAWLTMLYVAFYNAPSAIQAFASVPEPGRLPEWALRLPCGVERRGHRDPTRLREHLNDLVERARAAGGVEPWLRGGLGADRRANWRLLQGRLREVRGNGRWAAYKTGEVLQKVNDYPLTPTDMGNDFSTGPRDGLRLLYGSAAPLGSSAHAIAVLDHLGHRLAERLRGDGITIGIEQVETALCDFHALHEGRYYVGHDIDALLEATQKAPPRARDLLLAARADALPQPYLGERGAPPWWGVDKERKKAYANTGIILVRE